MSRIVRTSKPVSGADTEATRVFPRERAVAPRTIAGAFLLASATTLAAQTVENPKDVGLTERATSRLAQIDLTVSGADRDISGLTSADFEVRLNDRIVPNLVVDDFCRSRQVVQSTSSSEPPKQKAAPIATGRPSTTTYLFYFDMAHLTQSGRQDSIESARAMLPKLLTGGRRAMIIANAADLKTVVPLTSDQAKLDAALGKMTGDVGTFDSYAASESTRLADIVTAIGSGTGASGGSDLNAGGVAAALRLAARYAADERWRQERDLRRLSMVMGRFADLDPPKVALYFADTMRQNAGEHYLAFFGGTNRSGSGGNPPPDVASITLDAATGALALDRVINDAAAMGIRFYTIEGQGMTGEASPIEARGSASNARGGAGGNQALPSVNSQHVRDAQNTLVSLAAETGGRAFLNGVAPQRIAAQIVGDLSCVYLLSFDPRGFAQDTPLAVSVVVKKPKVKTSVRGRLVIQSDSARLTGRVLSAFTLPASEPKAGDSGMHVGLIPIGYDAGKFKARVQIALSGSVVPITSWDIGASVVSRGAVRQDGSGRIQVSLPNTPVVYETDMEFAPGDYDLVAVAHEAKTDTVLSKESHGSWPKIDSQPVSLGPIAVSQPRSGGFLRNGAKQTQGAVVIAEDEPLRDDVATAVIALVCGAKGQKGSVRVVRTLIGERDTPVGTTELDLTEQRCAQVVDLIPAKTLGAGRYRFVVAVSSDGNELARDERALLVPEKSAVPPKNP